LFSSQSTSCEAGIEKSKNTVLKMAMNMTDLFIRASTEFLAITSPNVEGKEYQGIREAVKLLEL
jgi:hypothetical protein